MSLNRETFSHRCTSFSLSRTSDDLEVSHILSIRNTSFSLYTLWFQASLIFSCISHLVFYFHRNWILGCSPYEYLVHSSDRKWSCVPIINWCWSICILRRFPIYLSFLSIVQILPNDVCTIWLHSHLILSLGNRLGPPPPPSGSAYWIPSWE